jgi:hypothetical protein
MGKPIAQAVLAGRLERTLLFAGALVARPIDGLARSLGDLQIIGHLRAKDVILKAN